MTRRASTAVANVRRASVSGSVAETLSQVGKSLSHSCVVWRGAAGNAEAVHSWPRVALDLGGAISDAQEPVIAPQGLGL